MEKLADLIGHAATLKLITDHGGTKVYIEKSPTPKTVIARSIGVRAARALARVHGGDYLELPNGAMLRSKKLTILRHHASQRLTARAAGATERYVRMVRNGGAAGDIRQGSLFPSPGKPSA
jgi:hypothetical protein